MLLKRNCLESVTVISSAGTVFCILLNYVTNISPITGVWLLIYIFILFTVSLCMSIRFIQWLLHLNRPIKYDLDWLGRLPFLRGVFPHVAQCGESVECKEYDTNELSVISTVLERRLVSSWYVPHISEEIGFPFACKQLLDQMINKTFQICHKVETKDVYVDMCAVLTTHLREYKKALKRHEKLPTSSIESLYKKTHPIFNSEDKHFSSADHCVNILRIILRELVPWELWDTPHSELLIRGLAKKLDNFVETTLSEPAWLNDKLFMLLKGEGERTDEGNVKESKTQVEGSEEKPVADIKGEELTLETMPPQDTKVDSLPVEVKTTSVLPEINEEAEEVQENMNNIEETAASSEPVEIKPTAVLRQRRGRQGRNEVKIYDRIIEGSVKTWETDMDLQCISVGQDLLASLDEMTLSRLWGQEDTEHSPSLRNRSPQPLWFGEEDSVDIDPPEPRELKKDSSSMPTEALLKDIQSTMHQAKTKIGDLQVPLDIDVPCKHSSDEAAGMMEGLLDMGLAGIKKGLRLTGLGDDTQHSQERGGPHHRLRGDRPAPAPPDTSAEAREGAHAFHKEENGNPAPPLVKQQRVTSQDSVPLSIAPREAPPPPPESPEPEYEEVCDLSTSIAKLRSLLQESGAARSDDIWWEGAEETRGRTQPPERGYSRHVDSAALADEYDMSGAPDSPRQTTNNMQRLDKLFQRTMTGVLNSIKTAVSAEDERAPPVADWAYVAADTAADGCVGGAVARLLSARRSLWRVDAALDSLQQPPRAPPPPPPPDDFEEWCAGPGAVWSGGCEVASAAGLARRHVAYRLISLLFAELGEALISHWLSELTAWLRAQVFVAFERLADPTPPSGSAPNRQFRPEETVALLVEKMPGKYMFGEDAVVEAARLLVASFGHKQVNRDVAFRALDLLAARWKAAAALRSPDLDNN